MRAHPCGWSPRQPYSEEAGRWAMVPKSTTCCSHGEPKNGREGLNTGTERG